GLLAEIVAQVDRGLIAAGLCLHIAHNHDFGLHGRSVAIVAAYQQKTIADVKVGGCSGEIDLALDGNSGDRIGDRLAVERINLLRRNGREGARRKACADAQQIELKSIATWIELVLRIENQREILGAR